MGYSPGGCKESDTTERLSTHKTPSRIRRGERGHLCLVPKKGESLQSFAIKYISGNFL